MEALLIVVVIAVGAYFFIKKGAYKSSQPKIGDPYACSGCGVQVKHNKRTVSAWGRGSRSFFCQSCHKKWREKQKTSGSGCLGVIMVLAIIPLAIYYGINIDI